METLQILDLAIEKAKNEKKILITEPRTERFGPELKNVYHQIQLIEFESMEKLCEALYNLCKSEIEYRIYTQSNDRFRQEDTNDGEKNNFSIDFETNKVVQNFSDIEIDVSKVIEYFNMKIEEINKQREEQRAKFQRKKLSEAKCSNCGEKCVHCSKMANEILPFY